MASTQAPYSAMRDLKWSPAEKTIARKAFDLALRREIDAVIREAKDRAASIEHPSELWDLERWLTQRRKEIDGKFDFRYSVLPVVFGNLLREGRLTEQDLQGLEQDKLGFIRRFSSF
jgi:hypothetical protein